VNVRRPADVSLPVNFPGKRGTKLSSGELNAVQTSRVPAPRERTAVTIAGVACAAGLALCCAGGAPILRHDWSSPYLSFQDALGSISGWEPSGLGAPVGTPSSFILFPAVTALSALTGPGVAVLLFVLAIGLVCALGAQSCARAITSSWSAQIAAALFAVFNPWVYTKLVAGHAFMLLSYGGAILLLREFLKPARSQVRLMLCGLLIAPQTQFFALAFFPALYVAAAGRQRLALYTWLLLALPVFVGVTLNRSSLVATPLTVSWENSQSIQPPQALILSGYSTEYAASFAGLATDGLWTIFGLAVVGCIVVFAVERRWSWLPLATAGAVMASFGTHAPWADLVRLAFTRLPETGLFRELYDLLGLAAAGYLALCACAARSVRFVSWIWLAAAAALLAGWIARPPQTFWVTAREVPRVQVPSPPNSRFALIPAFQPMSFAGRGSGIDPDSYPRADGVTPLNQTFPFYPASAALRDYLRHGDTRKLAALSVSCIVVRPWLTSDFHVLRSQLALPVRSEPPRAAAPASACIDYLPELTLSGFPRIGTLDTNIGAGDVFFGDAGRARGPGVPADWQSFGTTQPVRAPNRFVDARDGWVDARLAFLIAPELSQPYGGALTVNPSALLDVRPGLEALVFVRGALRDARGRLVSGSTAGYAWVPLAPDTTQLRCAGLCVVALQGTPPNLPLNPPAQPAGGVAFRSYTPWFASATLPAGPATFLRYNVAYNDLWLAVLDRTALAHVRVDGIVNGWFLPAREGPQRVYLVEAGALVTACAEIVSAAGIALSFLVLARRARRRASS
jgi:hypothetical protein